MANMSLLNHMRVSRPFRARHANAWLPRLHYEPTCTIAILAEGTSRAVASPRASCSRMKLLTSTLPGDWRTSRQKSAVCNPAVLACNLNVDEGEIAVADRCGAIPSQFSNPPILYFKSAFAIILRNADMAKCGGLFDLTKAKS